jgi:hypothetical protein
VLEDLFFDPVEWEDLEARTAEQLSHTWSCAHRHRDISGYQ